MKKVLLGMSGGVDSSVAALLLKKQGYEVIGAFMKNFSDTKNKMTGECSWVEERKMAQKIAILLGIPFITIDSEKEYKKNVIEPMFRDYFRGLTPNPDMLCNKIIKFPVLWREAKKIGAEYIATGHYARIKKNKIEYALLEGKDKTKDQSYFLAELTQNDLSHTLFPVGNLIKLEVREIARKNKFPNYDKKGTRGICFVGKVNMKSFLEKKIKNKKGKVIDFNGSFLGYHPGSMYFTIGQRIGQSLGFEIEKHLEGKWYVAEKRKNVIVIAPESHKILKRQIVKINNIHFLNPRKKIFHRLKARIRHLGVLHSGKLMAKGRNYYFKFSKPLEQVAEGQYIVLYKSRRVVASGEMRF